MKYTTNYNLKQLEDADNADLPSLCENFDVIDEALTPEVSQSTAPPTTNQKEKVNVVLGWLANRIKAITGKANWWEAPAVTLEAMNTHKNDTFKHVTSDEKDMWNTNVNSLSFHASLETIHITAAERSEWNAKETSDGAQAKATAALNTAKGYTDTKVANISSFPFGVPLPWMSNTLPNANCIWLEGQAVSRTTYAALFAILGTTYGAGDGSTTFNVPNLKGKVIVGLDAAQSEFDALGEIGGEKKHTLTIDEMPSHTHNVSALVQENYLNVGLTDSYADAYQKNIQSSNSGGGQAHNNLQPYITLRYMCLAK